MSRYEQGWGLRADFVESLKERQDLIHRPPDKDASSLWIGLPLWLLGSSIYTLSTIMQAVIGLLT